MEDGCVSKNFLFGGYSYDWNSIISLRAVSRQYEKAKYSGRRWGLRMRAGCKLRLYDLAEIGNERRLWYSAVMICVYYLLLIFMGFKGTKEIFQLHKSVCNFSRLFSTWIFYAPFSIKNSETIFNFFKPCCFPWRMCTNPSFQNYITKFPDWRYLFIHHSTWTLTQAALNLSFTFIYLCLRTPVVHLHSTLPNHSCPMRSVWNSQCQCCVVFIARFFVPCAPYFLAQNDPAWEKKAKRGAEGTKWNLKEWTDSMSHRGDKITIFFIKFYSEKYLLQEDTDFSPKETFFYQMMSHPIECWTLLFNE